MFQLEFFLFCFDYWNAHFVKKILIYFSVFFKKNSELRRAKILIDKKKPLQNRINFLFEKIHICMIEKKQHFYFLHNRYRIRE